MSLISDSIIWSTVSLVVLVLVCAAGLFVYLRTRPAARENPAERVYWQLKSRATAGRTPVGRV